MGLLKRLAEFFGLDCAGARDRGDDQSGGGRSQMGGHFLPRLVAQHAHHHHGVTLGEVVAQSPAESTHTIGIVRPIEQPGLFAALEDLHATRPVSVG